jgi:hypothetical protein
LPALPSSTTCVSSAVNPTQSVDPPGVKPLIQPAELQPLDITLPVPLTLLVPPLYVKHKPVFDAAWAAGTNGPTMPSASSAAAPRSVTLKKRFVSSAGSTLFDVPPACATAFSDTATHVRVASHHTVL